MQEHPIELELRAELSASVKSNILEKLKEIGSLTSNTKRLSVMFFGEVNGQKLDIRVRVTNGNCEVVSKAGIFGSHNRTEVSQSITKEQFIGMVRFLSQLKFETKIGERETTNFELPNNIIASVVSAKHICYLELEKISTSAEEKANHIELQNLASQLAVTLINTEDEFQELIKRLNNEVDWFFNYTPEDYKELETTLHNYFS